MRRHSYTDPITGDKLSMGEHVAWLAQKLFRRWSTMIILQVICVVWLAFGDANARNWWNYSWSDLAIIVENVTMLALFSQTRRDAVVMRETREIAKRVVSLEENAAVADAKRDAADAQRDEADRKREKIMRSSQANGRKLNTLLNRQAAHLRAVEEKLGVVVEDL